MTPNKEILLDVNDELFLIEKIAEPYFNLPTDVYFIPGKRYPLESNMLVEKYRKLNIVSKQPYLPFVTIKFVFDMVLALLANNTATPDLFARNPHLPTGGKCFVNPEYLDIDPEYLVAECLGITNRYEVDQIVVLLTGIVAKIHLLTNHEYNKVYSFNYEDEIIVMSQYDEIKSIRYDELNTITVEPEQELSERELIELELRREKDDKHRRTKRFRHIPR